MNKLSSIDGLIKRIEKRCPALKREDAFGCRGPRLMDRKKVGVDRKKILTNRLKFLKI